MVEQWLRTRVPASEVTGDGIVPLSSATGLFDARRELQFNVTNSDLSEPSVSKAPSFAFRVLAKLSQLHSIANPPEDGCGPYGHLCAHRGAADRLATVYIGDRPEPRIGHSTPPALSVECTDSHHPLLRRRLRNHRPGRRSRARSSTASTECTKNGGSYRWHTNKVRSSKSRTRTCSESRAHARESDDTVDAFPILNTFPPCQHQLYHLLEAIWSCWLRLSHNTTAACAILVWTSFTTVSRQ